MSRDLQRAAFELWDSGLSDHETLVLMALASYADDDGTNCFPGIAKLTLRARTSERTVKRALTVLVERGFITVLRRYRAGNTYTLNAAAWPNLAKESGHTGPIEEQNRASVPENEATVPIYRASVPENEATVAHYSSQDSSQDSDHDSLPFRSPSLPPLRNWIPIFEEIEHRQPTPIELSDADKRLGHGVCFTEEQWREALKVTLRTANVDNWLFYTIGVLKRPKLSSLPSPSARQSQGEIDGEALTQAALRNDAANRPFIGVERVSQPKPLIPTPGLLERVALRRTGT